MIYTPHRLEKRVTVEAQMDEFGRIVHDEHDEWREVCPCRCDDNDTTSFLSENGSAYVPRYHVVLEGKRDIQAGDTVRCLEGCSIRGEGEVYRVKRLNLLPYTEIWI